MKPPILPVCPASLEDGVATHYAPQSELDANGGVCAKCRAVFARRHNHPNRQRHEDPFRYAQASAFVDDHVEPTVEFAIEDGGVKDSGLNATAVLAVGRFCGLAFMLGGRDKQKFWQAAHAFAFASGTHPERCKTMEEVAEKFSISKAAFSKQVNRYRDILGLPRLGGMKGNTARTKAYRTAQTQSHAKRKPIRDQQRREISETNRAIVGRFVAAIKGAGNAH